MLFSMLLAIAIARPPLGAEGPRPDTAAVLAQYPLRKGARWIYEGKAEWTDVRHRRVHQGRVRDVMEVLQVLPGPTSFAAVVRGFPMDLAWYQPAVKPRISVVVCKEGRFYQRASRGLGPAVALARALLSDPAWPPREEDPFLDLPLEEAKVWGHDLGRDDALYRWVVEGKAPRAFPGSGGGRHPVFTASFATRPDKVVLEFAPGVGITAFSYEHHGAVARTEVRLVGRQP